MGLVAPCIYTKCSLSFLTNEVLQYIEGRKFNQSLIYKKLREFQNLHISWHYNYRHVFSVAFVFISQWEASLSMYVVIKFQDLSALKLVFATLVFYSFLVVFLGSCGAIHLVSAKILQKWSALILRSEGGKISKSNKYLLKQIRSMHPTQSYIGSFYFVTSETMLSVINELINNTVTLMFL